MECNSTKPDSAGKEAAIKRAALLTEFRWTPLRDIPTHSKRVGRTVLQAGVEVKGIPYSSVEENDKFITENVSFETFLSAIANPDSVLYEKSLEGRNSSTYYGIVCNSFVRYCLGIQGRYNTKHWADIPGMYPVKKRGTYTAEEIMLCDILYAYGEGRNHVALITGLYQDDSGRIVKIEVSEAVSFSCKREKFDPEEFFEKYQLFSLWRYALIDSVPEFEPALEKLLFEDGVEAHKCGIGLDYGNRSNYSEGEEMVISIFRSEEQQVEIRCRGETEELVAIQGPGQIRRRFPKGYYTVKLLSTGEGVEFCVNSPRISHSVENEYINITVDAEDPDSCILHMEFRGKGDGVASLISIEHLSLQEIQTGKICRKIPEEAENYKVSFQNRYGVWTHRMIPIR